MQVRLPLNRDQDLADGTVPRAINADFSVALQLCEPVPIQLTQQFEVRQSAVPTVKDSQFWMETTFSCLLNHVLKMIVLAQAILHFVVQAKITWQSTFPVRPHHRDQGGPEGSG